MGLVPSAFLQLAGGMSVIGEGTVVIAGLQIPFEGFPVQGAVVQEDAHADHALEDRKSPVPVRVGGRCMELREDGDEGFPEHFRSQACVFFIPASFMGGCREGIPHYFSGVDNDKPLQTGTQRVIPRGDLSQDGAVGADDFHRLGRMPRIAGDRPHQRVVVGRVEVVFARSLGVSVFVGARNDGERSLDPVVRRGLRVGR